MNSKYYWLKTDGAVEELTKGRYLILASSGWYSLRPALILKVGKAFTIWRGLSYIVLNEKQIHTLRRILTLYVREARE